MSTHSWAYQPSHPAYRTAWPTILHDTRRIVGHLRQLGIVITGPDGRRCRARLRRAVEADVASSPTPTGPRRSSWRRPLMQVRT
jgi:hypothetical protein